MYKLFLYFMIVVLVIVSSGFSFLGENDDWVLWCFLKNGENITLIMSYPLSSLGCKLYEIFPNIQWYSVIILTYTSIIAFLAAYHISKLQDRKLKFLFIISVSLILIHFLMNITVTELTILIIAFSLPFIYTNQLLFWFLFLLASLLRTELVIGLSPIFVLAYLLLFRKKSVSIKQIFPISIIILAIGFIFIMPSYADKEYTDWLRFVKARGYFMDLHGRDYKDILSDDEEFVGYTWWAQDKELLPTKKVIKAANPSSVNIIVSSYKALTPFKLLKIFLQYKLLIFLIPLTFYIIYKETNSFRKIFYIFFMAAIITLIIARDMERVAYPLTVLWMLLIYLKLYMKKKRELLIKFLYITIAVLFLESSLTRIYKHQTKESIKSEAVNLMAKHPYLYELSLGFPTSFGVLSMVVIQDHLFREDEWLSFDKNRLLLSGWISRHPFFYRSHDISSDIYERKYKTFYEFLTDKKTAFIGSKKMVCSVNDRILKIYDKKYAQKGCYHKIRVIDESKHFAITQIVKVCED